MLLSINGTFTTAFSMLIVLMLAYLLSHSLRLVGWPQAERQIVLDKSLIRAQTVINVLSKQGRVVKVSQCTF